MPIAPPPKRQPAVERALVKHQRTIAAAASGGRIRAARDEQMRTLRAAGYTQQAIANLLNQANAAEGQEPYSVDAVQKVLRRAEAGRR
jgi:D-alanyl-D-alanine carboxypeptidase